MKNIACLFPGIGYTCDKPLLYYTKKLLEKQGWEVIPVSYTGFPSGVRGDPEKEAQCIQIAMEQAEETLKDIDWNSYGDVLIVGKSVGTVVGPRYAKEHNIPCRQILFTPVEATFRYACEEAVAFHGTADPWADTAVVREKCRQQGIPLYETEGANHSLETGHVIKDIRELEKVMKLVKAFIRKE